MPPPIPRPVPLLGAPMAGPAAGLLAFPNMESCLPICGIAGLAGAGCRIRGGADAVRCIGGRAGLARGVLSGGRGAAGVRGFPGGRGAAGVRGFPGGRGVAGVCGVTGGRRPNDARKGDGGTPNPYEAACSCLLLSCVPKLPRWLVVRLVCGA